jgi:hypothetical protein
LSKGGISWSLSVTMQARDSGNAGIHSKSVLISSACFAAYPCLWIGSAIIVSPIPLLLIPKKLDNSNIESILRLSDQLRPRNQIWSLAHLSCKIPGEQMAKPASVGSLIWRRLIQSQLNNFLL